jgi:predicted negative regulator of RcsB-dependent stress response
MNLKKNPELIPLVEWWEKDGKSTVAIVAILAACFLGWNMYKTYKQSQEDAQSRALAEYFTVGELEEAVIKFKGTKSENLLKINLAREYFKAERYEEALAIYAELENAETASLDGIAAIGKAYALDALEKYDEALAAFKAFQEKYSGNYLELTAKLGEARVVCEKGDKKAALELLEALKSQYKDEEISKLRIDSAIDLVKRYVKREKRTLIDAANAVAKDIEKQDAADKEKSSAPAKESETK